MSKVVDSELHLEPVLGAPLRDSHHPRVVDEDVDPGMVGKDAGGGFVYGCQRRKIERL
jgi:hypothetical protein